MPTFLHTRATIQFVSLYSSRSSRFTRENLYVSSVMSMAHESENCTGKWHKINFFFLRYIYFDPLMLRYFPMPVLFLFFFFISRIEMKYLYIIRYHKNFLIFSLIFIGDKRKKKTISNWNFFFKKKELFEQISFFFFPFSFTDRVTFDPFFFRVFLPMEKKKKGTSISEIVRKCVLNDNELPPVSFRSLEIWSTLAVLN